jgi:hypothetical protein
VRSFFGGGFCSHGANAVIVCVFVLVCLVSCFAIVILLGSVVFGSYILGSYAIFLGGLSGGFD